ncbi:hypothetical protein M427DRAFT_38388 [Gonapodya prolifera JEL478]|uniref:F-box domain-containing protein n=1 Tax=Gonapodya prolifera (strain JEL478) TaxID=1344416 RepID=A0A138ZZ10_GONPJ|nr:hypothetical protein M427DRAFT_38388 [Gonapodya prolifera JEL478]|eukprot:KXS09746.1 hypothetical protein M427DRAFT_38388 [Gonapodya prolifera JEL478]
MDFLNRKLSDFIASRRANGSKTSINFPSLSDLPDELISLILLHLPPRVYYAVAPRLCRRWNAITSTLVDAGRRVPAAVVFQLMPDAYFDRDRRGTKVFCKVSLLPSFRGAGAGAALARRNAGEPAHHSPPPRPTDLVALKVSILAAASILMDLKSASLDRLEDYVNEKLTEWERPRRQSGAPLPRLRPVMGASALNADWSSRYELGASFLSTLASFLTSPLAEPFRPTTLSLLASSLTTLASHMGATTAPTINTLHIVGKWTPPATAPTASPLDLARDVFTPFPNVAHLRIRSDFTNTDHPFLSEIVSALASVPFDLRSRITSLHFDKAFSEPNPLNDRLAGATRHAKDPVGLLALCGLLPNLTDLGAISGRVKWNNYWRDQPENPVLRPAAPPRRKQEQGPAVSRPQGPRPSIPFLIHPTLTHLTIDLHSTPLTTTYHRPLLSTQFLATSAPPYLVHIRAISGCFPALRVLTLVVRAADSEWEMRADKMRWSDSALGEWADLVAGVPAREVRFVGEGWGRAGEMGLEEVGEEVRAAGRFLREVGDKCRPGGKVVVGMDEVVG